MIWPVNIGMSDRTRPISAIHKCLLRFGNLRSQWQRISWQSLVLPSTSKQGISSARKKDNDGFNWRYVFVDGKRSYTTWDDKRPMSYIQFHLIQMMSIRYPSLGGATMVQSLIFLEDFLDYPPPKKRFGYLPPLDLLALSSKNFDPSWLFKDLSSERINKHRALIG